MAIGTGAVSMSDIRTEWGRSGAISLSEMYRGGSHVRSKAANNTGTNLASTVPTSGTITIDNFRGTARGFKFIFSAAATNQNASTLFGDDFAVDYPKEIVINSGVELGATSTAEEALEINSGGAGTITVTNNGTLTGAGGSAGAAGGDAFEAATACTFINNGTIRSGGGGGGSGGNGGNGGNGSFTSYGSFTAYQTGSAQYNCNEDSIDYGWMFWNNGVRVRWNSSTVGYTAGGFNNTPQTYGGYEYHRGAQFCSDSENNRDGRQVRRRTVSSGSSTGGAGGAGGAGGVGAGYNQTASAGSSGSGGAAGGTNAGAGGTGGTGGTGGAFGATGASGSDGTAGANGNVSNGAAGSAGAGGGAAGAAIQGISNVTLTNNGTITGGQV